jgi:hypothetical protein
MAQDMLARLLGMGMQPGALDRLTQKMGETRGSKPLNPVKTGYKGNLNALSTQPLPKMYNGPMGR